MGQNISNKIPFVIEQRIERNLVHRLRQARIDAQLSQRDVARLLRKAQTWVAKLESLNYQVKAIDLAKLAGIYQKDITYFLEPIPCPELETINRKRRVR